MRLPLSGRRGPIVPTQRGSDRSGFFSFLQRLVPVGEAVSSPCILPRGVPADARPLSAPVAAEEGARSLYLKHRRGIDGLWGGWGGLGQSRTSPGWHRLLLWALVLSSYQSFLPPFPSLSPAVSSYSPSSPGICNLPACTADAYCSASPVCPRLESPEPSLAPL